MKFILYQRIAVFVFVLAGLVYGYAVSSPADQQAMVGIPATVSKVKPAIDIKAQPFDLEQVRLLDGPFKDAMEFNRRYLHELDADRLLHTFRINAGLMTNAEPLGGWESPNGELRGHNIQQYYRIWVFRQVQTFCEEVSDES